MPIWKGTADREAPRNKRITRHGGYDGRREYEMRYFIDGVEISEEQAKEQERKNMEYLDSMDLKLWAKIKFIK